jgi:heme oxygenase
MLQQVLKEATKTNHDELETLMFVNEIMSGTLSLHQYQQILTTNYIVHKAFEDFLFENLSMDLAQQLDISYRHKLAALRADMQELNINLPEDNILEDVIFEKDDASILGALYVMEGATLGGSVIVKKLQTNPQLNNLGLNFNYYGAYGDQLMPRWKTFCEVLNQQPESDYQKALLGARKMFYCMAQIQQNNKVSAYTH